MEIDRLYINGINSASDLAIEKGISLIRYTHLSDRKSCPTKSFLPEICGFVNLGNTCFMNSILQCLRHTRPLAEFCLTWNFDEKCMNGNLFSTYVKLMKMTLKGTQHIPPLEFLSHMTSYLNRFGGGSQQDAQEFLMFLLEKMHADLKHFKIKFQEISKIPRNNVIFNLNFGLKEETFQVIDIFVGTLRSTLKCTRCKSESHNFEKFYNLSLPTPETHHEISLMESMSHFMKQELMNGENKPMCHNCQSRQKSLKCFSVETFPHILIIHLKRYNDIREQKTRVNFPLFKLDMSRFSTKLTISPIIYTLYAVSNHHGSVEGGHYTALARGHRLGEWYHYNDTRITKIEEQNVVSKDAYILFYELQP